MIEVPPQLDQRPETQVITEGETLVMNCNATGNPTPSIVWSIGADVFPPGETLTIGTAYKFNAGTYACTATNGVSPDATATAYLTVNGTKSVFSSIFMAGHLTFFFYIASYINTCHTTAVFSETVRNNEKYAIICLEWFDDR